MHKNFVSYFSILLRKIPYEYYRFFTLFDKIISGISQECVVIWVYAVGKCTERTFVWGYCMNQKDYSERVGIIILYARLLAGQEKTEKDTKADRKKHVCFFVVLRIVFLGICLLCATERIRYYASGYRYKKDIRKLSEAIGGGIVTDASAEEQLYVNHDRMVFPDETEYDLIPYVSAFSEEIPDLWKEQYSVLFEKNRDCIGYLEIPGTAIAYPVMFTPSQYDYYLNRDFDKKYDYRGLPFLDGATQIGLSRNYIIYAHDMKDGTGFGTLRNYTKAEYASKHPLVYFNTPVSTGVYQVLYVCRYELRVENEAGFRYYRYGGVLSEEQFNAYLREMKAIAVYQSGMEASWGDELLSLSTCDHYDKDKRLVVVCRRIS